MRTLVLAFLTTFWLCLGTVASAQVIHQGDLGAAFHLRLEGNTPFIVASLQNKSSSPIALWMPAGLRLHGTVEPSLPVLLGRDIKVNIPPGGSRTLKVEALSLSFYPHTAGRYEVSFPDEDSLYMSKKIQKVWKAKRQSRLSHSPLRLSQAIAYVGSNANKVKIRKAFSEAELREAIAVLKRR